MEVKIQYIVGRSDPRYNGDLDDPNFNDGVVKEEIKKFRFAFQLWEELHKFRKYSGVETSFGQYIDENKFIPYISHKKTNENSQFETIVSES